ncbi:hypothetical protein Taro_035087 [Colocasia esculenta]|uniref:Uncharacterized protein n=1 Tax=Colocasia esculenta TaxID=4460 RepID=A0A843W9H3_COLES|nr:hypothetical protein [Colocasia esculenta]
MDLQLCVCRCGVSWSPQLFDFFLVERQLDLSSVTARLRGVEVVVVRYDLPLIVFYPSLGLAVYLVCSGVVSDMYHQQLCCSSVV